MKLNQNKKQEILNLPSCSKDLLIWIQLQALQDDIIEISYKHYTKGVKISLNTFKKALGGLLDSKVLFATSKKNKFKLNKDFIDDSLGDYSQIKILPKLIKEDETPLIFPLNENQIQNTLVKLKPYITEQLKTQFIEEVKQNLLNSKVNTNFQLKPKKKTTK